ncbi:MAG: hypothetical protein RIQ81_2078 [Pseudomonadota bacterium]|jgi:hypothetical protein
MVTSAVNPIPEKLAEILGMRGVQTGASMQLADDQAAGGHGSTCPQLNRFLDGALVPGSVSEWGMPAGHGARELALSIVAQATLRHQLVLWVNGNESLDVYPPAWSARGVDLGRLRFVQSGRPVEMLKPVFLERLFDLIVIDCPKHLGADDWAFLARQARTLDVHVMVLQDFLLSGRRGNIWARVRINCVAEMRGWQLKTVRGPAHEPCHIERSWLFSAST